MSSNLIGGISFLNLFFFLVLLAKISPEESWPQRKIKRSFFLTYQEHDYSVCRYSSTVPAFPGDRAQGARRDVQERWKEK